MRDHPVIYLSAARPELRSALRLAARIVTSLDCEPIAWQEPGSKSAGQRRRMRRDIDDCDALIQLVGQTYGDERFETEFGEASESQFEAFYARRKERRVWYVRLAENFPTDHVPEEPPDLAALQAVYRTVVASDANAGPIVETLGDLDARLLAICGELRFGEKKVIKDERPLVPLSAVDLPPLPPETEPAVVEATPVPVAATVVTPAPSAPLPEPRPAPSKPKPRAPQLGRLLPLVGIGLVVLLLLFAGISWVRLGREAVKAPALPPAPPPLPEVATVAATPPPLAPAVDPQAQMARLMDEGLRLRKEGNAYSAADRFTAAEKVAQGAWEPTAELALTYEQLGFTAKAEECWRRIYAAGPAAGPVYDLAKNRVDPPKPAAVGEAPAPM